jgi:hypothetical protein
MSFTYELDTPVGRVRRDISDRDSDTAQFTDEELQSWIDEAGSTMAASGLALWSWASALAREDKSVKAGSWSGDRKDVVKEMLLLSDRYLEKSGYSLEASPTFRSASVDWTPIARTERIFNEPI